MGEKNEEGLEATDPLFKIEVLAEVLIPILVVGVGDDAADESAVSDMLEVTSAFEHFLSSALSTSGTLGTESVAPTVGKLHMEMQTNSSSPIHED